MEWNGQVQNLSFGKELKGRLENQECHWLMWDDKKMEYYICIDERNGMSIKCTFYKKL